jgi:RNA polymerase primary sigma factor
MADNKEAQAVFLEAISSLKEYAKVSGGQITKDDVLSYFKGMELDNAKLQMIYGYLMANNIKVKDAESVDNSFLEMMEQAVSNSEAELDNVGVQKSENEYEATDENNSGTEPNLAPDSRTEQVEDHLNYEEDEKFLQLYLEDLKKIEKLSDTTRALLLMNVVEDNDKESLKLFGESFLDKITEWIAPYARKGVLASDLVQEGNLAMMAYVSQKQWMNNLEWKDRIKEGNMQDLLAVLQAIEEDVKTDVEAAIQMMVDEQKDSSQVANKVLNKVNLVNDWAVRLKNELGRKPTIAELAQRIGISEENVQ